MNINFKVIFGSISVVRSPPKLHRNVRLFLFINPLIMAFIRPKIIGTLTIQKMMAGNLAVKNDIKNSPNKIIVQCRSKEHGEEIIAKIKAVSFGDKLYF